LKKSQKPAPGDRLRLAAQENTEDKMSGVNISVDEELVEPIVRAEIQTAIVRQLESDTNLIPKLVEAALGAKVNKDGYRDKRYSSDNKYLYIDWLCKQAIQTAAKEAMNEYLEENHEKLKVEVKKQLRKSEAELASIFVEGLIGGVKSTWSFKVNIDLPSND